MYLQIVLDGGTSVHKGDDMKRPAHRPSEKEVNDSIFYCSNGRHYSENDKRKINMGLIQVDRGLDPSDVCKRLFGSEIKDIVEILVNGTQIE